MGSIFDFMFGYFPKVWNSKFREYVILMCWWGFVIAWFVGGLGGVELGTTIGCYMMLPCILCIVWAALNVLVFGIIMFFFYLLRYSEKVIMGKNKYFEE